MTRHNSMAIAGVIRDLRYDRLLVADRFAAMLAKDAKLPGSALTLKQAIRAVCGLLGGRGGSGGA